MDDIQGQPLWHQLDDQNERCEAVIRTCDGLEELHKERLLRILANLEVYEGKKLGGLYPSAYLKSTAYEGEDYDKVRLNEARAVVNTAIAKIAGKQRPRAQFVCSEANWSTRRKAKKLEKFVDAVMLQRQGGQVDAFDVGLLMFRDLCVADSGWLKIWADPLEKKVCIDRVLPWEILVDPNEARYGQPQNLFHVYGYDRYKLIEQFPKRRKEILEAKGLDEDDEGAMLYGHGADVSRMVKVRECWHLPAGPDAPGRHSLVIATSGTASGIDLTVNRDNPKGERWTRTFFPFEGMTWEPHLMGIYGTSLVDNVAGLCDELNAAIQRRAEAETLGSNAVIICEEGAIKKEHLEDNRPFIIIEKKPGTGDPTFHAPDAVSQGSMQWGKQLQDWVHDASGVSQQDTAAQKQPGLDSGIAIREIRDIGSERFAIQWQRYEKVMAVGLSRHIIACMRELAEILGDDELTAKWPGGDYFQDIKWSNASLEDAQYHTQVYSVSGLVNTPADRLALATELVDRGFMSKEVYLRVIQAKDIDAELGKTNSASQWIEKCIESWMDATEEDYNDGTFRFKGPPPRWLGPAILTDCILQVGLAYLEADIANCPEWNKQWFERFMTETDHYIQEFQDREAMRQNAAKGNSLGAQVIAGGPPPPPGMPPGPPPPPGPMPPPMPPPGPMPPPPPMPLQ